MRIPARPRSPWIATATGRPFPRLRQDVEVDVAIVGGGLTGLTAALLLKGAGRTVAVLEARRVAEQVTGGTTAHLTEALDADAVTLIRDFGEDGARSAYRSLRAALQQIASIVAEEKLDAGFRRVPAWWWTETADGVEALEAEQQALRRARCSPVAGGAQWIGGTPARQAAGGRPGEIRDRQQHQKHERKAPHLGAVSR